MATPSLLYSSNAPAPNFNGTLNLTNSNPTGTAFANTTPVQKTAGQSQAIASPYALSSVNPNASFQNNVGGVAGTPVTTPTLTNGTPASLGGTSVSGGLSDTASEESAFDNSQQAQTIMDQYKSALSASQAATAASNTSIQDQGAQNINFQNEQSNAQGTHALESQRGFVVNPGQIKLLQDDSTNAVRILTQQMNDALGQNNTQAASAYANLALQETTAMTNARTNFLNTYFGSQTEARTEQAFPLSQQEIQSQIQQNLASAASSVAGAALTKAQAAQTTALTPAQIEATLAQAGASSAGANQSNASAAQTNALTAFLRQGSVSTTDPNVQSLLNGSATPEQIQAKYPTSLYGGYAASIISSAQSNGYSLNAGTLAGQAQSNLTGALSSGNPFSLFGGLATEGVNAIGSLLSGGGSSSSLGTTVMTGPGGTYNVPNNQVATFKQNGYSIK